MPAMHEIELKFQIDAAQRNAVSNFIAGRSPARRTRLQAAYFDTPDRALARASMALRVRREGRRWVQTLKGLGQDGLTRDEHNVALELPAGQGGAAVQADPARHRTTSVGQRLLALLGSDPDHGLACLYRTDIWRRVQTMSGRSGTVELAFDEGALTAGERHLPVCELEIELLSGSPLAVMELAKRIGPVFGLWLDTRSKAERGDMLSRGVPMAPACAGQAACRAGMGPRETLHAVLSACSKQVNVNASQVASGLYDAEHVHQLRVGLRRLCMALRRCEGTAVVMPAALALVNPAARWCQSLAAVKGDSQAPHARRVVEQARSTEAQALMLDLLSLVHVLGLREGDAAPSSAIAAWEDFQLPSTGASERVCDPS
jgi:triphosphatase